MQSALHTSKVLENNYSELLYHFIALISSICNYGQRQGDLKGFSFPGCYMIRTASVRILATFQGFISLTVLPCRLCSKNAHYILHIRPKSCMCHYFTGLINGLQFFSLVHRLAYSAVKRLSEQIADHF
jgi:hypothetical protein